jgi:hypothetical protein
MKQDKLEKFIIENREQFDIYEPGSELWDRINKPVPKTIRLNWKAIVLRVAAVIVIFVASWVIHDMVQKDDKNITENKIPVENGNMGQVNILMEAEMFYTSQINTARDEIIMLSGNDKLLLDDLNTDMVELDEVFEDLKNDLKDNSDNEEVIGAMIQNYRIKLEVLEEILMQLKKSKNFENLKNDSDEI